MQITHELRTEYDKGMASIKKHGDGWRAQFFRNGVRKSKVCKTKTEAIEWVAQVGVEVMSGEHGSSEVTLHWALDRYAREVCVEHRGCDKERIRIQYLKKQMKDIRLTDITPKMLAKWRDERTTAPATVLRDMKLLNSFFEQCRKEWGYIAKNPLKDVAKPKEPPPRRRGVSQEEIDTICAKMNFGDDIPIVTKQQEIAVAFLLAIETGMRKGEMLGLTKERIHLDRRFVELEMTKNGDRRQVPLSKRAVQLLRMLPEGVFTVSSQTCDALFRKHRPSGLHFHDSRSEGITRLAKKLDVLDLARMIGHRDVKSLLIYYAESAEAIAAKLD